MTRHGSNCTASAVYSYHERKKDSKKSGYGRQNERLGKDSIKNFDCCSLSLQPCKEPVLTPQGVLFDKENILKNIIHQKKEIARKLKEYERQKCKSLKEEADLLKSANQSNDVPGPSQPAASISNMSDGKDRHLPSFWAPSLTPGADAATIEKPDGKVRCPVSGSPLKFKDLIDIHFTEIADRDDKRALIVKEARYVCPVTNDVLGNSVPCVALLTSGNVVTTECYERLIKPDMVDPTNGKKLNDADVIPLQRGATGFAGAGITLKATKDVPAMLA